ncbi:MAG: ammonium transporter [Dehalococcoidia bacterium]
MPEISAGDTAFVLVAAALVMLMTPGLGFFYGGLVRNKNVLGTIMHTFIILALVSVIWVLWGYTLAFGPDVGKFIGDLQWAGLKGVGQEPGPYSDTIPHLTYMTFQGMFAIITPALIVGAFAERIKFSTLLVFITIWLTIVYAPVAHWVWGGGWLGRWGALDFAGGTVVHINSGVAALAAAIIFGRRLNYGREPMEPHNITYVVLGAALLWFGWFGFNAGSALAANGLAANAFVVTNTAAASAALAWMGMTWWRHQKPSVVGAAAGAVAGLVAITPASGFVEPWAAIIIGLGAGVLCYLAVQLRIKLALDDSLDVWGVHGVGGTWGAIATGIFVVPVVGGGIGATGLIDGDGFQFGKQVAAVFATWGYSFVVTFAILKVLERVMGLRVSEEEELVGVDVSLHGERAYTLEMAGGVAVVEAPAAEARPTATSGDVSLRPALDSGASEGSSA